MAQDATKVVATQNYVPWYAPYSGSNALPADTINWNNAWGGAWIQPGYTTGGLHFATATPRTDIRVDQELDVVLRPVTSRTATMNFNLAQFQASLIAVATGQGSVTTVAATTAARGHDDYALLSTVTDSFYSVGFDVMAQDQLPIRFAGWRALPVGSPTWDITPEAPLVTPMEMTLLPDNSTSPARIATVRDVLASL